MNPMNNTFPVFEANQVLTNRHLNMVVDHLAEQERLTRVNLIGIGITCGLDLTIDVAGSTVNLHRGCAVTSEGYLIVEQDDVDLTSYREYTLPEGDAYAPFMNGTVQLPIWELFPDGEPDTTLLSSPGGFLNGKTALLFVELDAKDLSDCGPNNCDDKGKEVTITVRRLLMSTSDVDAFLQMVNAGPTRAERLALPDLRLPRYNVPRENLVTTQDVLESFLMMIKQDNLVTAMKNALSQSYQLFKPILADHYPGDPFGTFMSNYGFLQTSPSQPDQIVFLQYYVGLFRDLIAAYDEFRWKGAELMCLCAPDSSWFPRHVILGPTKRTPWYPSSASCCECQSLRDEVIQLFIRIVVMCRSFTNQPSLPKRSRFEKTDRQIRISPSRGGQASLSRQAIPYYYEVTGDPTIYDVWSHELTSRGREDQNTGYRSPDTDVLLYDLSAFDHFRIEGHLGKDYRMVLRTLLAMRSAYRLPFDVIAVRTGAIKDGESVDVTGFACHFQDLEAMYDALRTELICLAKKSLGTFGRTPLKRAPTTAARRSGSTMDATFSTFFGGLVEQFFSQSNTLGSLFAIRVESVGLDDVQIAGASSVTNSALSSMALLVRFTRMLEADLSMIDWDEFQKLWSRLKKLAEDIGLQNDGPNADDDLTWQELNRQIVSVVYACRIEGFLSIRDEYRRRVKTVSELRFFSTYTKHHPAIQHTAGVPTGGTFIVVYHEGEIRKGLDDLEDGIVIADFFLPYLCCSDCPPIQYQLPPEPVPPPDVAPTVDVVVGCTTAAGLSPVSILVTGGKAPYQMSIDDQPPVAFDSTIELSPGGHTVKVIDALNLASVARSFTVANMLSASEPEYRDLLTAAGLYTASFTITGGTAPYVVSSGSIQNNIVTVGPLKFGETVVVTVTDASKCSTTVTITRDQEPACNKPCDGKAIRCRYSAWSPRPSKGTSYAYKDLAAFKLTVADADGTEILGADFTEQVRALLMGQTVITDVTYNEVMKRVCDEVSRLVAEKLGPDHVILAFDAETGSITVEHYACHVITASIAFVISGGIYSREETWTYGNDGVKVQQRAPSKATYSETAFGCISLDKCAGSVGQDCRVGLTSITPSIVEKELVLTPVFSGNIDPNSLRYSWRIETPLLITAKTPTASVPLDDVRSVRVQLLVTDKQRCWAYIETSLTPNRTTPIRVITRRPQ